MTNQEPEPNMQPSDKIKVLDSFLGKVKSIYPTIWEDEDGKNPLLQLKTTLEVKPSGFLPKNFHIIYDINSLKNQYPISDKVVFGDIIGTITLTKPNNHVYTFPKIRAKFKLHNGILTSTYQVNDVKIKGNSKNKITYPILNLDCQFYPSDSTNGCPTATDIIKIGENKKEPNWESLLEKKIEYLFLLDLVKIIFLQIILKKEQ